MIFRYIGLSRSYTGLNSSYLDLKRTSRRGEVGSFLSLSFMVLVYTLLVSFHLEVFPVLLPSIPVSDPSTGFLSGRDPEGRFFRNLVMISKVNRLRRSD